jgi:hypothetical protein
MAAARKVQSHFMSKHLPERPITLDVPLSAHGLAACFTSLGIEKQPAPTARRFCAGSGIVFIKAPVKVSRPADIGPCIGLDIGTNDVDEEVQNATPSPKKIKGSAISS